MSGGGSPRTVLYDSNGDAPLVGQGAASGSLPVVLAADHPSINVNVSGSITGSFTLSGPITGSVGLTGPITGSVGITGPVAVSNFPATQIVSASSWVPQITGSVVVSNRVDVTGSNWIQTVTGSMVVANRVDVSGSNWIPTITGSVVVANTVNVAPHNVTVLSGSVSGLLVGGQPVSAANPLPTSGSWPAPSIVGALGALNATVQLNTVGLQSVGMQLAAGTLVGTIVPEVSFDDGTTWNPTYFSDAGTGALASSLIFGVANTVTGRVIIGVGGSGVTRVRVSAYTGGTANATLRGSNIGKQVALFEGIPALPGPPTVVQMGGTDGTNMRVILTDITGRPLVTGSVGLSGPVAVSNFPATQVVSASNWVPTITGSVVVANTVNVAPHNVTVLSGSVTGLLNGGQPVSTANPVPITGSIGVSGLLFLATGSFGYVSVGNSTTVTLAANASFTGSAEDVKDFATISVGVRTDASSSIDGFKAEYSSDGVNWDGASTYTIDPNVGKFFTFGAEGRYFRIRYLNGSSPQTVFRMQTVYHVNPPKASSHRIDEVLTAQNDAELVKAVIAGKVGSGQFSGSYVNATVDEQGRLIVATANAVSTRSGFIFGKVDVTTQATALVEHTTYTEQAANARRSLVSLSGTDSLTNTGARVIKLTYYDVSGSGPKYDYVSMGGLTPVNTNATDICYIEKMEVVNAGSYTTNIGNILLKTSVNGTGSNIGSINGSAGQTFWAHHYVASGSTCYITGMFGGKQNNTSAGSGGTFIAMAQPIGTLVSGTVNEQVTDFLSAYGQANGLPRSYATPIQVPGPARIQVRVLPESALTTTYLASLDFYET